jgi:multiple sugar transport system ATP-binding protein
VAEIVFDDVSKRYADGTAAVTRLSLRVADGEFMILVGPSGCGKTTALRMVAGLEEVSEGQLRIGGDVVNERAPKDRDVAMVFQTYALYPQMSVRANMGFALKLAKVPRREIDAKVREAAEILDLTKHLDRKPRQLSGGQRQRVAMGRAIVRTPKAFLMDEPLSNLDAKLRVEMRASIARIQRRLGTTTLYVTHDQVEAMTLGDRVAVMRDGVLQQVGPPKELYDAPVNLFVAGFLGSPPMNFVEGTLDGRRLQLPFGEAELPDERLRQIGANGTGTREVIAGLRPENFDDAALIDRAHCGAGLELTARPDLVEELGGEMLVHLPAPGVHPGGAPQLHDGRENGSRDPGNLSEQIVARLGSASDARRGEPLRLWLNTNGVELFDPTSGENLRMRS